jgi:hypothetical protein
VDINTAIDAYSHAGGNRLDRFRAACLDAATADKLAAVISALQQDIVDQVWAQAGDAGLTMDEIERLAHRQAADGVHDEEDRTGGRPDLHHLPAGEEVAGGSTAGEVKPPAAALAGATRIHRE